MNKFLTALTAASLVLAAAGCTPDTESPDADTAESSAAAASPSAEASASPSVSGPAAPGSSASPSGSPAASATPTDSAVAEGFPTEIVPVMPGSTPLSTSFEETPELFTASLTGTTDASTEEILAFYASTFEAQGFTPSDTENQGTATLRQFVRSGGEDTANVTVVPRNGSMTYTASINTSPESAE